MTKHTHIDDHADKQHGDQRDGDPWLFHRKFLLTHIRRPIVWRG